MLFHVVSLGSVLNADRAMDGARNVVQAAGENIERLISKSCMHHILSLPNKSAIQPRRNTTGSETHVYRIIYSDQLHPCRSVETAPEDGRQSIPAHNQKLSLLTMQWPHGGASSGTESISSVVGLQTALTSCGFPIRLSKKASASWHLRVTLETQAIKKHSW